MTKGRVVQGLVLVVKEKELKGHFWATNKPVLIQYLKIGPTRAVMAQSTAYRAPDVT